MHSDRSKYVCSDDFSRQLERGHLARRRCIGNSGTETNARFRSHSVASRRTIPLPASRRRYKPTLHSITL